LKGSFAVAEKKAAADYEVWVSKNRAIIVRFGLKLKIKKERKKNE